MNTQAAGATLRQRCDQRGRICSTKEQVLYGLQVKGPLGQTLDSIVTIDIQPADDLQN